MESSFHFPIIFANLISSNYFFVTLNYLSLSIRNAALHMNFPTMITEFDILPFPFERNVIHVHLLDIGITPTQSRIEIKSERKLTRRRHRRPPVNI